MTEVYEFGPFTTWAPKISATFLAAWFAPWANRRPRFWFAWGWFLFLLLFVAFMYFVFVPFYGIVAIWAVQVVTWAGQGVKWLAWDSWHSSAKTPPAESQPDAAGAVEDNQ